MSPDGILHYRRRWSKVVFVCQISTTTSPRPMRPCMHACPLAVARRPLGCDSIGLICRPNHRPKHRPDGFYTGNAPPSSPLSILILLNRTPGLLSISRPLCVCCYALFGKQKQLAICTLSEALSIICRDNGYKLVIPMLLKSERTAYLSCTIPGTETDF